MRNLILNIKTNGLLPLLLTSLALPLSAQVPSENYVQTTLRISDTHVLTTTQYYDGLGRPFEKVEQGVTPSGDNLIHLQQYDGLGREWRSWSPIYSSSAFLNPSNVSSLSQSQYSDSRAFSQNNYESNPLNRVVEVEGIGEDWKGHSVKSDHLINTSSFPHNCKYYRVSMSGELQDKGYYPEGRLYVTKTTDEDGHESYEFKNLAGHVILQRVMLGGTESADTYYIYDYRGNLSFVLPPNYQDEEDLELYAYQYKYDGRGNCIWKKLPGCEPIIMKYYRGHHLAFMQDGNLRKQGQWLFYVYDKLGRQVVTGTTAVASDVSDVFVYAEYTGTGVLDGYQLHGLTITPRSFLVTNYYDDYAFMSQYDAMTQQNLSLHLSESLESAFPSNSSPNATGNQTGKKVYLTDGTDRYMLTSLYYGKKGRVVQSHSSNLLGGWEHTYSSYTYAGSLQQTKHVHTTNGKQDVVEEYDYAYDHAGRLVKTSYSVNGSAKRELSVKDYDDYCRISRENIMGKDAVLHNYNVRNWPLSIESDNFKERLCYNVCNNGLCSWRNLYNGNIGAMSWQCGNGAKRAFHFTYNAQNMLTDSGYNEGDRLNDGQGNYDESLSYDKMGNVQSLLRSGLLDDGSYGLIDNLSYNYHGNQLLKVDDAAVGPYYQGAFHFVDGADEAVEYEYDANGNMTKNLNKGITSISYDLNNQPRKIEYNDGRNASYVYDAEGNKLSVSYNLTAMSSAQLQMSVMQSSDVASANVSNGQKTIDYCGNIIYDGEETMILNDVGYALYDKGNTLTFHYYLKDHLGNNRVVVSEDGEIEQVNDYYPTGALMASSKGGDTQRFKYNGKELDRTNGLNWYDYGARNYDAAIVRWDGMDKLCEKYVSFTPYGYCKNNFVNAYDPNGMETHVISNSNGTYTVIGGILNNDRNIYTYSKDKNGKYTIKGKSIGITTSTTSFYNSDKSKWINATLNPFDTSGKEFLNKMVSSDITLDDYIINARNNHSYDFKVRDGSKINKNQTFVYRGMIIGGTKVPLYSSARDIGNMAAGIVAAKNGIPWIAARAAFDAYQSRSGLQVEGLSTRNAEHYGWLQIYRHSNGVYEAGNLKASINSVLRKMWSSIINMF